MQYVNKRQGYERNLINYFPYQGNKLKQKNAFIPVPDYEAEFNLILILCSGKDGGGNQHIITNTGDMKKDKEFNENLTSESITLPFKPFCEWIEKPGINNHDDIPEWGLSEKLSKNYGLSKDKINHLIKYVIYAFGTSSYFEEEIKVIDFNKNPEQILSVRFESLNKNFTIKDQKIISKMYKLLIGENNLFKLPHPYTKEIVTKIATQVFRELTEKDKLSKSAAYCIIGFILAYYSYGVCKEKLMTEGEFIYDTIEKENKGTPVTNTYLQYLADKVVEYIED